MINVQRRQSLFDEAFSKIVKEISRQLLETIKSTFEAKDFISLPTIEALWLMDINSFSDLPMDESRCYVTLDGD
jgi:hypothetical protein